MKRIYSIDPTSAEYPYLVVEREEGGAGLSDVTSLDTRLQQWIPHEKEGYIQAEVFKQDGGDDVTVKTLHGDVSDLL